MSGWVWGVDVAVQRLAFGFVEMDTGRAMVETLRCDTSLLEGERLALVDERVRRYAYDRAIVHPPHAVFVEQPSGPVANLQLGYVAGVVQAALATALGEPHGEAPFPVWTVTSGDWKKWTVGFGNASKDQVAAWTRSAVTTDFETQDEADAICVAVAGRMKLQSNRWAA